MSDEEQAARDRADAATGLRDLASRIESGEVTAVAVAILRGGGRGSTSLLWSDHDAYALLGMVGLLRRRMEALVMGEASDG